MIFHGRFMGAVLGYSNLKSVDPRSGVHSVINILFWIIRGFLVCVPSWGGAAFLGAGRLFLAEAQEKAIGEPLKSLLKRNTRRPRLNYSPATMFTLTLTGGHKDRRICWCFFYCFVFFFCRCLAIHLRKWSIWKLWLSATTVWWVFHWGQKQ